MRTPPRRAWLAAAVPTAFALVALGFPSWDWYFDGVTFAMAAEGVAAGGDPAWLLHPHHLLYGPVVWAVWRLAWHAGLAVRAWLVMQWFSTACAVASLAAVHRLAVRLSLPEPLPEATTAALACTYGFWRYATQGDTTSPELLVLQVLLLAATRPAPGRRRTGLAVGVLLGAGILVHQTAVLIAPAVAWALWRRSPPAGRRRVLGACAVAASLVVGAGYAAAAFLVLHPHDGAAWRRWLEGYFGVDPRTGYAPGYGGWHPGNAVASLRGAREAVMGTWPGPAGAPATAWWAAAGAVTVLLAALVAIALRARFRTSGRTRGRPAVRPALDILLVWLAVHAVFFTWWKPGHARFWVLALPGWFLLAATGLAHLAGRWSAGRRPWWPIMAWLPAALLALVVGSGPFRTESSPACNRFLPVAETLAARTPSGMTIVISGVGPWTALKAYLPYVARRTMLVLDWQFADPHRPPAAALAALRTRLDVLATRGAVVVLSEALDPALDAHFLAVHGVSGPARRAAFARLHLRRAVALSPDLDLLAPTR